MSDISNVERAPGAAGRDRCASPCARDTIDPVDAQSTAPRRLASRIVATKKLLNPLIEMLATRLMRVDHYPDVLEKLASGRAFPTIAKRLFAHKIPAEVRANPTLFIHIPKNGGTSIKRMLYRADPGHATARLYDCLAPDWFAGRDSFAVIRDPRARFLSGLDFLLHGGGSHVKIVPAALHRLANIDSIDGLLDHLERIEGDWLGVDTFLRPQWWYVVDRKGVIAVQQLLLLEAHQARLAALLGVDTLPHLNRTKRAERSMTSAQEARLRRLYAPDFSIFAALSAGRLLPDEVKGRTPAELDGRAPPHEKVWQPR